MGRKIRLARIEDERKRKSTFKKKRGMLFKKLEELSILCDVKAAAIVYSPGEDVPIVWPSHEEVVTRITKFNRSKESFNAPKMVDQESYLADKVVQVAAEIKKEVQKNEEREAKLITNQIICKDVDVKQLDRKQQETTLAFLTSYLKQLEIRNRDLQPIQDNDSRPQEKMVEDGQEVGEDEDMFIHPTFMEEMMTNEFFLEAMNEGAHNSSCARGRSHDGLLENVASTSGSRGNDRDAE